MQRREYHLSVVRSSRRRLRQLTRPRPEAEALRQSHRYHGEPKRQQPAAAGLHEDRRGNQGWLAKPCAMLRCYFEIHICTRPTMSKGVVTASSSGRAVSA